MLLSLLLTLAPVPAAPSYLSTELLLGTWEYKNSGPWRGRLEFSKEGRYKHTYWFSEYATTAYESEGNWYLDSRNILIMSPDKTMDPLIFKASFSKWPFIILVDDRPGIEVRWRLERK